MLGFFKKRSLTKQSHLNNRFLITATAKIAEKINNELGDKWSANTAK